MKTALRATMGHENTRSFVGPQNIPESLLTITYDLSTTKWYKQETKMKYKKWLIHIIFMLRYLVDSAAVFSSSFTSGASVDKTKVRTVVTTYKKFSFLAGR
jgi:hypothetical protein